MPQLDVTEAQRMQPQPPDGLGRRDRILWAAASMLGEGSGAAPSVRAVAARAGVSPGSVQHHFPTQRELMDEVLVRVYDALMPEEGVHDTSIPPRDRLVGVLQRQLAPMDPHPEPRDAWRLVLDRYASAEPTEALRAEYVAVEREQRRRIEYCLTVLEGEGALAPGDTARRARFLAAVVAGLSIAQALPAETPTAQTELEVLRTAADYVLSERPAPGPSPS